MAHYDAHLTGDQEATAFIAPSLAIFFEETDHEILSVVILSLLLEGQLSVSCNRMCASTGQLLRGPR